LDRFLADVADSQVLLALDHSAAGFDVDPAATRRWGFETNLRVVQAETAVEKQRSDTALQIGLGTNRVPARCSRHMRSKVDLTHRAGDYSRRSPRLIPRFP